MQFYQEIIISLSLKVFQLFIIYFTYKNYFQDKWKKFYKDFPCKKSWHPWGFEPTAFSYPGKRATIYRAPISHNEFTIANRAHPFPKVYRGELQPA